MFDEFLQKACENVRFGHCVVAAGKLEAAHDAQLCVAGELAAKRLNAGVSEHDTGKQCVPHRPDRVVVATVLAVALEVEHQVFIG